MIEGIKKDYDLSNSLLLSGNNITAKLPEAEWRSYCDAASLELFRYRSKVIPQTSQQLQEAVEQGLAIMMVDLAAKRLLGFAQIKKKPDKLEINSWLGLVSGVSRPILMAGANLGFYIDSSAAVIAKVREGNVAAEKVIKDMGGKLVGYETSEYHFNPDSLQPLHKSIFDVSFITLMPSSPPKTILESLPSLESESTAKPDNIWKKIQNSTLMRKFRWFISNGLPTKM